MKKESMKHTALYRPLVDRYLDGSASPEEVEVFFHLLNEGELEPYLSEEAPVRKMAAWKKYSVAAAVLLLVGAGVLLLRTRHAEPMMPVAANVFKNDVPPGGNKAVLTLGDGSTIVLDSAASGKLASQGKTEIVKTDAGTLAYNKGDGAKAAGEDAAVLNNTLSTPAGGQYQVTLADGTKVWLNALSKLQFPSAFKGRERVVELRGEAYFEVAKDRIRSFFVRINGVDVQVLGTSFNVNAYPDEAEIKTTLLEGAVKLVRGETALTLKPGQQGVAGNGAAGSAGVSAGGLWVRTADLDQVMAWKNGLFSWDAADVHTVMRQISRWYGVTVKYEGAPTSALFGGEIGRDLSLTQVLTGLSKSKVHFKLEGTTLTVLP